MGLSECFVKVYIIKLYLGIKSLIEGLELKIYFIK